MSNGLTEEQQAGVCRSYAVDGMTVREIAAQYDVTKVTIARWLRIHGVPNRLAQNCAPKLNPDQEADICRLYTEEGQTIRAIAPQFGICKEAVRRALNRCGVVLRPRLSGAALRALKRAARATQQQDGTNPANGIPEEP